jgi:hypothetical protein
VASKIRSSVFDVCRWLKLCLESCFLERISEIP